MFKVFAVVSKNVDSFGLMLYDYEICFDLTVIECLILVLIVTSVIDYLVLFYKSNSYDSNLVFIYYLLKLVLLSCILVVIFILYFQL